MTYNFSWNAQTCSPKFMLNAGMSASGKVKLKSVTLRNVHPQCLTPTAQRLYLQNILGAIVDNDPFSLSLYRLQVDGKFYLEMN